MSASSHPGRPRDPKLDDALLQAGLEVFLERGYEGASLAEIGRRAGVGTPAIYRRWPSKQAMAIDLMARGSQPEPVPETGSIRGDLVAYLRTWQGEWWTGLFHRVVLPASAAAGTNATLANEIRASALAYRRPLELRIHKAIESGELRPDTSPQRLLDLLGGSVAVPQLFGLDVPRESEVEAIVDQVLEGFAAKPSSRPRAKR